MIFFNGYNGMVVITSQAVLQNVMALEVVGTVMAAKAV